MNVKLSKNVLNLAHDKNFNFFIRIVNNIKKKYLICLKTKICFLNLFMKNNNQLNHQSYNKIS